jgi:hypothetical protein
MRLRIQFAATLLLSFLLYEVVTDAKEDDRSERYNYIRECVGSNADHTQSISDGKVLAKASDAESADQLHVFGAVHVDATPERDLKFASGIDALRKLT